MVMVDNSTLSVSLTVRRMAWLATVPTASCSNHLPETGRVSLSAMPPLLGQG